MRARCNITHRLFWEILIAWQICAVSISSISRSMKTSPTRAGSLEIQSLNISQNSALIHEDLWFRFPFGRTQIVIPTLIDELMRHLVVQELQIGKIRLPAKLPEIVADLVF